MSELEKMVRNLLDEYMEMKIMSLICQKKEEQIDEKMKNLEEMLSVFLYKPPVDLDKIEITVSGSSKYLELILPEKGKPRFQKWSPKKGGKSD